MVHPQVVIASDVCLHQWIPQLSALKFWHGVQQTLCLVGQRICIVVKCWSNGSCSYNGPYSLSVGSLALRAVYLEPELQKIGNVVFAAEVYGDFRKFLRLDGAFFRSVSQSHVEPAPISGSGYTDVVVRDKSGLKHFILPVCVCTPIAVVIRLRTLIISLLIIQLLKLSSICQIDSIVNLFETERSIQVDNGLTRLCLFRRDYNNSIGAAYSKNGQR
ncbi:hypothetical protein SDC9_61210 [bioreactor metagenome]|uniref:Uncharacterized protein n=1 Tax=bioreactor metagenome TaxID=1076179 RepID=A0A644XF41_9ZZZZ